jgi:hypothetical protein
LQKNKISHAILVADKGKHIKQIPRDNKALSK